MVYCMSADEGSGTYPCSKEQSRQVNRGYHTGCLCPTRDGVRRCGSGSRGAYVRHGDPGSCMSFFPVDPMSKLGPERCKVRRRSRKIMLTAM